MPFISKKFVALLLLAAAAYFLMPARWRRYWLIAVSLIFYAFAGPLFLAQILAATGAAFLIGREIEAAPDKKAKQPILAFGIVLLAANLIAFKYTPFFNETARGMFGLVGVDYPIPELHWLMPLGISFYTFQLIAYLVDVFRGEKAERDIGVFALFVTFFPKIVSGPIERGKALLPQLRGPMPGLNRVAIVAGLQLGLWGLFKKVVIADRIGPYVSSVYDAPHSADGVQITFATWLYAFQLYADFSGYTDMARGIALIFGIRLMQNFDRPYFAVSIQDFWKRWHISLTSWLTDYVYNPITRQRTFKIKLFNLMLYAMMITFVVSGFWHGAAWTYVLWGALHGTYIVISLLLQKRWNSFARAVKLTQRPAFYRGLKIAVTFTLVCFAYLLFRAQSLADSAYMMTHLGVGWEHAFSSIDAMFGGKYSSLVVILAGIAILMGADLLRGRGVDVGAALAARPVLRWSAYYAAALAVGLLGAFYGVHNQFIYFQF